MNVALVTPYRLREVGGVTTFLARLRDGLEARGHRAYVLQPGHGDRIVPVGDPAHPHTWAVNLREVHYQRAPVPKAFVAFWVYLPSTLRDLSSFLRRQHIDVVHLHFPTPRALYFSALRPVSRWRQVITVHGSDIYALPTRSRLYRALLGRVLARADAITAVSVDLLRALRRAYPGLRTPSCVIRNGNPIGSVDSGGPPPDAVRDLPRGYVVAVGSLIRRKGYDVLLRALRLAQDQGHRIELVILGGGPEEARLRALAGEVGVSDQVVFAGEVPHALVTPFYRGAKFFVHAAREEAQGLVLQEALSCGKAVLATRVNGIPELIRDGETGLLVEPEDPDALAAGLVRLEKDPALRQTLAERGREFVVRELSWDRLIEQYLEVYEGAR
jgi:glycosyltransferase involved in cell wall biosynthesis